MNGKNTQNSKSQPVDKPRRVGHPEIKVKGFATRLSSSFGQEFWPVFSVPFCRQKQLLCQSKQEVQILIPYRSWIRSQLG